MDAVACIAEALRLPTSGQDWGIEHSDPSRLGEFLAFASFREPAHAYEFELLAELIFQSAEDAHESDVLSSELQEQLVAFVHARRGLFPHTFSQWRSMLESEWYVPTLLRAVDEA